MTRPTENGFIVGYLQSEAAARETIRHLRQVGFREDEITLMPPNSDEPQAPVLDAGDRMRIWGMRGVLWGFAFGVLLGAPTIFVPETGLVKAWGSAILASAIEGAAVGGGFAALWAGVVSLLIWIRGYLPDGGTGRGAGSVLIARGRARLLRRARRILLEQGATKVKLCQ